MGHRNAKFVVAIVAAIWMSCLPCAAFATKLSISVTGNNGAPLVNAVVSLHAPGNMPVTRQPLREMDQREMQFQPHVLVVPIGGPVRFPNSDNIRHQVYSFSPAKTFELPLYSGQLAKPVVFDKPGVVELGCNIHDWMIGYIVVVDTSLYGLTDAKGKLVLDAPAGNYQMQVWHELQKSGPARPLKQSVKVSSSTATQNVVIEVQPAKAPAQPADERLRKLQEKFRKVKRD